MNDKQMVDLRSDTVTKPSPEMRRAMAEAEVGDDVFGDDPTINLLQEKVAELLGKEAALYVPSGSMANATAIRAQTRPGEEIIAHFDSHAYHYEGGSAAVVSGCSMYLLHGERGLFTADDVRAAIRPDDDHFTISSLVVVENTQNRGGGTVWPLDRIAAIHDVADEHNLKMHLDGARLMNACIASGHSPTDYAQHFDTVAICFSKGLGAPVGSAVAGTAETIKRVHRARKMLGGGMRQAGIIAAGALYALEHNIERLVEDHINAKRLAMAIAEMPGLSADADSVETNIVYFDVDAGLKVPNCVDAGSKVPNCRAYAEGVASVLCDILHEHGVGMLALGPQRIRAVTHLDVSAEDIDRAITIMRDVMDKQT